MAKDILKIGIAGLGTVGTGVVKILQEKQQLIEKRSGKKIEVVAVSARDKSKDRGIDLGDVIWKEDASQLADVAEVDVVVELIGGADGIALDLARKSLSNKKSFVTANKALIANHGFELAELAEENGVELLFEASVAGGIPVIGAIKKGLTANQIIKVSGILNGTCNYILTSMQKDEREFESVLKEAQELGYAEADPTFDVDGIDTAHKIAILASLSFGTKVSIENMHIEGIRAISISDIKYAEELGYKIKLLGIAKMNGDNLEQRTYPCLVSNGSPVSQVDGVLNAASFECDSLGPLFLEGPGAGELPTASAVVADIVELACGNESYAFGMSSKELKDVKQVEMNTHEGQYYIKFRVSDEPGVLAAITSALSEQGVGADQVLQPHSKDKVADIVIVTHKCVESAIDNCLKSFSKMEAVLEAPHVLRIEN